MNPLKIAIIGPESTGKTTLIKKLAHYYKVPFVLEYARDYMNQLDRPYVYDDLLTIAKTQYSSFEQANKSATSIIFSDSSLITIEIWSRDKFNKCDTWISEQIMKEGFDVYLLCGIDIPWQYDVQREDSNRRLEIFNLHLKYLTQYNFNYHIISGLEESRLKNAIKFLEKHYPIE